MLFRSPSAGAELAVCDIQEVLEKIQRYEETLKRNLEIKVVSKRQQYENYKVRLRALSPEIKVREKQRQSLELERRLEEGMKRYVEQYRHRLQLYIERMNGLSPASKLNQGYSFVSKDAKAIKSVGDVKKDDILEINVTDGTINAKVVTVKKQKRV